MKVSFKNVQNNIAVLCEILTFSRCKICTGFRLNKITQKLRSLKLDQFCVLYLHVILKQKYIPHQRIRGRTPPPPHTHKF